MKVVMCLRGEFGLMIWWYYPAVHAIDGEKVVYHEPGMEALLPSATILEEVPSKIDDGARRNRWDADKEFVDQIERLARSQYPGCAIVRPEARWPRRRFIPQPTVRYGIACDVVVAPRRRDYGKEKNWPYWESLTGALRAEGLVTFAGGARDTSYEVPGARAWDFDRPLDATIEAMHAADLVIATDAGLAHLAVLCGRPLLMLTHAGGLVAPGPVTDETGKVLEDKYWPVHLDRYREANHTSASITLLEDVWNQPKLVLPKALELLA